LSAHEPSGSTAPQFYPVILAGGSGERFWPLSRKSKPKQFLTLDDSGFSLIQATVNRLAMLPGVSVEDVMIVTGVDHRMQVLQHLPDLPTENLLVEPWRATRRSPTAHREAETAKAHRG